MGGSRGRVPASHTCPPTTCRVVVPLGNSERSWTSLSPVLASMRKLSMQILNVAEKIAGADKDDD